MFLKTSKEDLVKYHHSLGQYIRNYFKLWEYSWEPVLGLCDFYPRMEVDKTDQISMRVIEQAHEELCESEGLNR